MGQHTRNILGFPAIDEINLYYEISASKPVTVPISTVEAERVKAKLEAANLRFTNRRIYESVLEDLTKFILGIDSALLRRAPLAGIRGEPSS